MELAMADLRQYDVFLNYRGPDLKKTFVSQLDKALRQAGCRPFLDGKLLLKGQDAFHSINQALSGVRVHVAIFSPRYAESKYCLNELCDMLASKKPLIPVYYDVEPWNLRCIEEGPFAEAFCNHLKRRRDEDVVRWKAALLEVAKISAFSRVDFDNDSKLVEKIVAEVLPEPPPLPFARHVVGLKEELVHVVDVLDKMGDNVGVMGICGTGGIGKTTLASEVYNLLHSSFSSRCFLMNVNDAKGVGVRDLQMKMMTKLLRMDAKKMHWDPYRWLAIIQRQKILLVIDDISSREQFDELLPNLKDLAPGSRVIVTSRDRDLLNTIMLDMPQSTLYEVPMLSFLDSLDLLIWWAFQKNNIDAVDSSFHDDLKEITVACGGLPLSLKVIGAFLADKTNLPDDEVHWRKAIYAVKNAVENAVENDKEIISILRRSYDNLRDDEEKHMFLDVACFMLGHPEQVAMEIWGLRGTYTWPYGSLQALIDKSFVKVDSNGRLSTHDLLRDMGRTIAMERDPSQGANIWQEKQVQNLEVDFNKIKMVIEQILGRMEELRLNKIRIWSNQCEHLLKKFQLGVDIILGPLQFLSDMGNKGPMISWDGPLVKFICCMLEGEALFLSCGEHDNYDKAAFALTSPPPSVSTFSKFALVLRELDWTVDFICYVGHLFSDGRFPKAEWEWNDEKCRHVYRNDFSAMQDESLEVDGHRQTKDREAIHTSLYSKPTSPPCTFRSTSTSIPLFMFSLVKCFPFWCLPFLTCSQMQNEDYSTPRATFCNEENQDALEGIWKKRLLATSSHTSGSSSEPLDWFYIDEPKFTLGKHIGGGSYKNVYECNWLGVTVAVAVLKMSEDQARAEAGILAKVQHPNVVELMGYAYKDDKQSPQGYLVTELMKQDLESLIIDQLGSLGSAETSLDQPPFVLSVAVDMALQIVEAMIHLKECGVLHRDLKPQNCLVNPKYRKDSLQANFGGIPMFYTIKLIDFGTAKMRGHDSYFHTRKKGTPYYMAPEVYERSKELYTWSADVYSFGMTCYRIFTGRTPFKLWTKFSEVQEIICNGGRPTFPTKCPSLLKELIERCWAQNPSDRPTFQDIRKDLWQCKSYANLLAL